MEARSYPNYNEYMSISPGYDLQKWMNSMRDIYIKVHLGHTRQAAVDTITHDWNSVEKREFLDWMKYYESGDYLKYKKAQHANYYVNDDINYFLPNPPNIPSPIKNVQQQLTSIPQEAETIATQRQDQLNKEEKRKIIEEQRRRILGRLHSVEKLLSSNEGHIFAGPEFEKLLIAIYELKKQIQTANKISLSARTCLDLIIRQANILQKQGHLDAAQFLVKLAQQTPGDFSFNLGEVPAGGSLPQGGGSLGNNYVLPPNQEKTDAIKEFVENMEGSGITKFDDQAEVDDVIVDEDDVLLDQDILPNKNELMVEAQTVPTTPIKPEPLEVEEKTPVKEVPKPVKTNVDTLIEQSVSNLTLQDAIQILEEMNYLFKSREFVRRLSMADMILNKYRIAQYFPSLGEVIAKNLENTNYSNSRLEDILSRLRGGLDVYKSDLPIEGKTTGTPIKQHFEQKEEQDQQRRELKKQVQDKELMDRATKPTLEVESPAEEIAAAPATAPTAQPVTNPTR